MNCLLKINNNELAEEPWSSVHYHDSLKWGVRSPESRVIRSVPLEHYEREE